MGGNIRKIALCLCLVWYGSGYELGTLDKVYKITKITSLPYFTLGKLSKTLTFYSLVHVF